MPDSKNFKVLKNMKYGRYAVASKTLDPGELIITEVPFACGPKADAPPICLGCHSGVDGTILCTTCSWPVCNEECEKATVHADYECSVFAAVGIKFTPVEDMEVNCPQYECIMPLRVLLAKEKFPEKWDSSIKDMESHEKERRDTDVWRVEQVNVVEFLHKVCRLRNRFSEELIHFVCGVLEINAFSVHNRFGYELRCLYPESSLLSHSCIPNVSHSIFAKSEVSEEYQIYVRAATKLERGQELLLSYTQTLAPTLFRRAHLREGKFFECSCLRCSDPTELGTNLSSLKCEKCDDGCVISSNPLEESAQWECTRCEFITTGESVMRLFRLIQKEINELDHTEHRDPVAIREAFLKKYQSVLHSNNALLLTVKHSLTQLYGTASGYFLEDLSNKLLERKVDLCRQLLKIADIIKPGYSRQRGWNLYELQASIIFFARNQFSQKEIDEKTLQTRLEEAAKYLEESAIIFSMEDPQSAEGFIGKIAYDSLKDLRHSLRSFSE